MRTFRRLLYPFAAASAFTLAIVAQFVAAGTSPDHENAASMRAGDSPVRLGAASPGADASVRIDTGVPAAEVTVSPSAGWSPGGSTASPRDPTGSPGSPSGPSGGSVGSPGGLTSSPGGSIGAPKGDVPKGLEKFYKQKVSRVPCKDKPQMQCVNVKVPLDYKKSGDKTIIVAMTRFPAKGGKPTGSLFINLGGPGSSGIAVLSYADRAFSRDIMDKYDIISFDPRGVGPSTSADCSDDREMAKMFDSDYNVSTVAGCKVQKAQAKEITEGCRKHSGELFVYVGTESAARDMDVLRGLADDEKLNYLGFSYGMSPGGVYAGFFPRKVGRMVLDNVVDAGMRDSRRAYEQELEFEHVSERYAQHCVSTGSCPLGSPVDAAKKKMRALLDQTFKKPFPTSNPNRKLTCSLLTGEVGQYPYVDASWPDLDERLGKLVRENDGSAFEESGSDFASTASSSGAEALIAINCADYVLDPQSEYAKYGERLKREAPIFGGSGVETKDRYICAELPYHPKSNPGPYRAKGPTPIVAIGVGHDSATLYSWTRTFTGALDNSALLIREGDGHTAHGRAGSCIQGPVDKYLLIGEVPRDGLVRSVEQKQGQNARQDVSGWKASVKDGVFAGEPCPFVR